ncbi:hypothetical protein BKA64DRAFT_645270 [Cadophora sp. MPI-SDFR-AT-0126]|nr:hypothetical protein BKA64DRAFT_645270 [Leotiomycetes sp. MPI-SDFR-AT-0126]
MAVSHAIIKVRSVVSIQTTNQPDLFCRATAQEHSAIRRGCLCSAPTLQHIKLTSGNTKLISFFNSVHSSMSDLLNFVDSDLPFDDSFFQYFESKNAPRGEPYQPPRNQTMESHYDIRPSNIQQEVEELARGSDKQMGTIANMRQVRRVQGPEFQQQWRSEDEEKGIRKSVQSPPRNTNRFGIAQATNILVALPHIVANPPAYSSTTPSLSHTPLPSPSVAEESPTESGKYAGNFACPVSGCNKRLSCKGNLNRHLKTHTDAKDWACQVCKRPFSEERWVRRHQQNPNFKDCYAAWVAGLLPGSPGYVPPSLDPLTGKPTNRSCGDAYVRYQPQAAQSAGIVSGSSAMQHHESAMAYTAHRQNYGNAALSYNNLELQTVNSQQKSYISPGLSYTPSLNGYRAPQPLAQAFLASGSSSGLRGVYQQQPYIAKAHESNKGHTATQGNLNVPLYAPSAGVSLPFSRDDSPRVLHGHPSTSGSGSDSRPYGFSSLIGNIHGCDSGFIFGSGSISPKVTSDTSVGPFASYQRSGSDHQHTYSTPRHNPDIVHQQPFNYNMSDQTKTRSSHYRGSLFSPNSAQTAHGMEDLMWSGDGADDNSKISTPDGSHFFDWDAYSQAES